MRYVIFLLLNFGALALGALLMIEGPLDNQWYQSLQKAPWTPPGWFFGFAWTTIMICYSIYMGRLWQKAVDSRKQVILLFALQWFLNVFWNPVFFHFHWMGFGMLVILLLESTLCFKHFKLSGKDLINSILIAPYLVWLLIALSLNAYAWYFA